MAHPGINRDKKTGALKGKYPNSLWNINSWNHDSIISSKLLQDIWYSALSFLFFSFFTADPHLWAFPNFYSRHLYQLEIAMYYFWAWKHKPTKRQPEEALSFLCILLEWILCLHFVCFLFFSNQNFSVKKILFWFQAWITDILITIFRLGSWIFLQPNLFPYTSAYTKWGIKRHSLHRYKKSFPRRRTTKQSSVDCEYSIAIERRRKSEKWGTVITT